MRLRGVNTIRTLYTPRRVYNSYVRVCMTACILGYRIHTAYVFGPLFAAGNIF